jgi:hypothetical protein
LKRRWRNGGQVETPCADGFAYRRIAIHGSDSSLEAEPRLWGVLPMLPVPSAGRSSLAAGCGRPYRSRQVMRALFRS